MKEQRGGAAVGPLQVVEGQEQRLVQGDSVQDLGHLGKELGPRGRRVHGCAGRGRLGGTATQDDLSQSWQPCLPRPGPTPVLVPPLSGRTGSAGKDRVRRRGQGPRGEPTPEGASNGGRAEDRVALDAPQPRLARDKSVDQVGTVLDQRRAHRRQRLPDTPRLLRRDGPGRPLALYIAGKRLEDLEERQIGVAGAVVVWLRPAA